MSTYDFAGRMVVAGVVAFALGFLGHSPPASAQEIPASLGAEHFEPGASQHTDLLNLQRPDVLGHLRPSFGLFVHFVDDPLQVMTPDGESVQARLVDDQLKTEVGAALGLFDLMQVGVVVPVVPYQTGDSLGSAGAYDGAYVSDIRATVKARLVNPEKNAGFGVSLASVVFVPSGANASFNSDGGVRGEPRVSVSWQSEGWEIIGNAGFQFRPATDVRNLAAGPSTRWGLGGVAPVGSTELDLFANVFGSYTVVQPEDGSLGGGDNSEAHPVEALAGVRYDLPGGVRLQAGGGTGLTAGVGAPDFRVFTSVHWAFRKRDTDGDGFWDSNDNCPERAEDEDDFEDGDGCPDPDNDDDGIEDSDDGCPEEAEDADDFEDADGCPDPDNDGDGIADEEDRCPTTAGIAELEGCPENDRDGDGIEDRDDECPMDPEDEDGFEDDNGCPDPDNDGDGITDAKDECPDEPEVENGLADADGCPDADTDGDGIRDAEDECPEEAEVVNGIDDEDGCPDEKESKVKVVKQKIEISEKVHFATNKAEIQQRSFELLREVAGLLEKYPQITKIRVAGHTDSHGSADYNKKLSKERAEAVRLFLIEQGIGRERLGAKGFGEEEPIALNRTEEGRAANRRVEFVIVEVDGQPVEPDSKIELETEKKVEE